MGIQFRAITNKNGVFLMGYLPSMTGKTIINEGFDGTLVGISWDI